MFPVNQWGGTGTPNYGLYQNPQMTSGIPMQMQGTGFPTGMLPNAHLYSVHRLRRLRRLKSLQQLRAPHLK